MNEHRKSGQKKGLNDKGQGIRGQGLDEKELSPRTSQLIPNFFFASAADFKKIPGSPIAYWATTGLLSSFEKNKKLGDVLDAAQGMKTLDNERFIREWTEVSLNKTSLSGKESTTKWLPINHGGDYRKWFGNNESVLNWKDDGYEIKELAKSKYNSVTRTVTGIGHYFKEGITWTAISSSRFSVRRFLSGFLFTNAGMCAFGNSEDLNTTCCLLNSKVSLSILEFLSPTINFGPNQIKLIPINRSAKIKAFTNNKFPLLFSNAKLDWDSFETSWDFTFLPLLQPNFRQSTLKGTYSQLRAHWNKMTMEMQRLEEENNRIFIEAYGLQDELTPDVPINEITLTCNPYYRYGSYKSEEELEALLLSDTMKEFISYAVGCMFGRYSLERPGLILANQGEDIFDFRSKILDLKDEPDLDDQSKIKNLQSKTTFMPDIDNVIPILDGDWFHDDISERFRKFLRVSFGEEHFEENLKFIEKALGKDIRKYFLKDFYSDHVKRYKKRPIYWLFSSPKGSFNALIYMHRYRLDTISLVLNGYLREFRTKLCSSVNHLKGIEARTNASQAEKTKALKEIEKLNKIIKELEDYEREVFYPLATARVEIDLDDGVKVNYGKFGAALKKIPGLGAKED